MNKQEVIEKIKGISARETFMPEIVWVKRDEVLDIINQLNEPEKPVVPRFVAVWYEKNKDNFENKLLDCGDVYCFLDTNFGKWLCDSNNKPIETLVMMYKLGYEVEEEKLYTVELPNPHRADVSLVLGLNNDGKVVIFATFTDNWKDEEQYKLTEAEIKKDFDWAWQFAEEVINR